LATSNLLDTYEKLFPRSKYKMNSSKTVEINIENPYYLKQPQGHAK